MAKTSWWCDRHGDFSRDRAVSIGSRTDENGHMIADQCGQCIDECEAATWD